MGFVPRRVVASSGEISELVHGDDYHSDIGRALEWPLPASAYGDLAGASVLFQARGLRNLRDSDIGPIAGSVAEAGLETQRVVVELSGGDIPAETGEYRWEVQITTAAGQVFTPLRGLTWVVEDLIQS